MTLLICFFGFFTAFPVVAMSCEVGLLDTRYEREVRSEKDLGRADRAARALLSDALVPWLKMFADAVLRMSDDDVEAAYAQVRRNQPLIGPMPIAMIDDLVREYKDFLTFDAFLFWLTYVEDVRVGEIDSILADDAAQAREVQRTLNERLARDREVGLQSDPDRQRASIFRAMHGHRFVDPSTHQLFLAKLTPALKLLQQSTDRPTRIEMWAVLSNLVPNVAKGQYQAHRASVDTRAQKFYVATRDPEDDLPTDGSFERARGALTPVGRYGPGFDRARLRTTNVLTRLARTIMENSGRVLFRSAPDMFLRELARVRSLNSRSSTDAEAGVVSTLQEGIISLNQLITLVLGNGVPNQPNGDRALERLLRASGGARTLITDLTLRHAMGSIGPAALGGLHYHDALIWRKGRLMLTGTFKKRLAEELRGALHRRTPRGEQRYPGSTGRGCPVAVDGALDDLAHAYLRVFRTVRAQDRAFQSARRVRPP